MSDLSVVSVNENEYRALASGAALQLRPQYGILLLGDRDRADFLQRMTTNDIGRLQPGQAALTVLTSPVARIDAVFDVLGRQDDLMLLAAAGQADFLRQRLQSQIFFMDKVTVSDESGNMGRLRRTAPTGIR